MSIVETLTRSMLRNKHRLCIQQKEGYRTQHYSYTDLQEMIGKFGRLLEQMKIQKGDKILLLGKNGIEWITVFLGATFQGVVVVPLDIQSDTALVRKIAKQTKPKALFTSTSLTFGKTTRFSALQNELKALKPKKARVIAPHETAQLLYTSGTTGIPKGVVLTHENLNASLEGLREIIWLPRFRFLSVLPLSHILEQMAGLLLPLSYGCSVLYPETLRPGKIKDLVHNKSMHALVCVPALLQSLPRTIQLTLIGIGGAKLEPILEKQWKHKLLLQGYGLTETAGLVSTNTIWKRKSGTSGKPLPGVSVKIRDEELLVKGKNVFSGYYKNAEKTKEVFEDGWFKTGDMGEFRNGYVTITGRKKDMIVTATGENVYPEDVEEVLNSFSTIEESCVVLVDGMITAAIVSTTKKIDSIIEKANRKLLPKQRIKRYEMWDSIPKTPTGKVKRYLVREGVGKKKTKHTDPILHILQDLSGKKVSERSTMGELSIDSLQRVQLTSRLEEHFYVEIPEFEIQRHTTARMLRKLIEKKVRVQSFNLEKWLLTWPISLLRMIFQQLFFLPLTRIFARLECEGREHIPHEPVIFMSNHQSSFDAPIILRGLRKQQRNRIAIAASPKRVYGIMMKRPWYGWAESLLIRIFFNTYPFGQEIGVDRSLEYTGELLDRGYSILVFPEGRRTLDGHLLEFQRGTGFLALNMNVPIVPVKIENLYHILPEGHFWPKGGKTKVSFGKPLRFRNESYPEATRKIRKAIEAL